MAVGSQKEPTRKKTDASEKGLSGGTEVAEKSPEKGDSWKESNYGNQHKHIGHEQRTLARGVLRNVVKVARAALIWIKDCES